MQNTEQNIEQNEELVTGTLLSASPHMTEDGLSNIIALVDSLQGPKQQHSL